ncbi:hypothetical protein ACFSSG_17875 [Euzebyella marina]|nr:hypothetical protein [Euzebyella marina]
MKKIVSQLQFFREIVLSRKRGINIVWYLSAVLFLLGFLAIMWLNRETI